MRPRKALFGVHFKEEVGVTLGGHWASRHLPAEVYDTPTTPPLVEMLDCSLAGLGVVVVVYSLVKMVVLLSKCILGY